MLRDSVYWNPEVDPIVTLLFISEKSLNGEQQSVWGKSASFEFGQSYVQVDEGSRSNPMSCLI